MSRKSLALLGAASVLSLSVAAQAADPELTILDWAGWEIDGMLQRGDVAAPPADDA